MELTLSAEQAAVRQLAAALTGVSAFQLQGDPA